MANAVEAAVRGAVSKGVTMLAHFNRERMRSAAPNPFVTGLHAPMDRELTLTDLQVTGTIPRELDGRYVRMGPNPVAPVNHASYHWFIGEGMVHGVRLKDGKALWYRNRWIRSNAVSDALGEPRVPGTRAASDLVNTHIVDHAGANWAVIEAGGFPVRLDEDLNTVEHDPFGGTLHHAYSAHPHLDPETGELHAICYKSDVLDKIWHVVVDPDGRVRREEPISVRGGPMIHDCMVTCKYVVVMDLPCAFSMKKLIAGHEFPYAWDASRPARVGLLPREGKGSEIIWCDIDPCYVFHPANGFDAADGTVILDVCAHQDMFVESGNGPVSKSVPFERWTIDPASRRVTRDVVDSDSQEFPRFDERFLGKPYRWAFSVALPNGGDPAFFNQTRIFRHDLHTGTKHVRDFGPGRYPGEFAFVARGEHADEGDGWLLGYVIDANTDTTDLVILDAMDFTGTPVASVHLPHRVPAGFHGNWLPAH